MQIQRVNRTDAEKVYLNVKNGFATTLTTGYVASYDLKGDSTGKTVSQPQTGTNSCWYAIAGVAAENIAAAGYGRVGAYGVHETYCSSTNAANDDIEVGQVIGPLTATFKLVSNGLSDGKSGVTFVAAERIVSNTNGNAKVFIRAL